MFGRDRCPTATTRLADGDEAATMQVGKTPMRAIVMGAAVAVLSAVARAASAEPSAVIRCDGYGGRMHTGEALARLPLIIGSMGLLGSPEPDRPSAREAGEKGVLACSEALTDPRVTGSVVRRGEILLMRGIDQYGLGNFDAAFADGAAIAALQPPAATKGQFDRTLGASGRLLQGFARHAEGRQDEAEAFVAQAADLRPWGRLVANLALAVMASTPAISADEARLLERSWRQWPGDARAVAREAAGDWAGAARDDAVILATRPEGDVLLAARRAAALALAGDRAAAEAALQEMQQKLDELAARASGGDAVAGQVVGRADELVQLTRVQLALNAGRTDEARTLLNARPRWLAPVPIVAAVAANLLARGGTTPLDPVKLRADLAKVQHAALTGPQQVTLMTLTWPRFEEPDTLAGLAHDLAPGATAIKQQASPTPGWWQLTATRAAFMDTNAEAMFVAAAAAASARHQAAFAVVKRESQLVLRREGAATMGERWNVVFPGDAAWAGQASRAIGVDEVETALGPLFTAPAARR